MTFQLQLFEGKAPDSEQIWSQLPSAAQSDLVQSIARLVSAKTQATSETVQRNAEDPYEPR